LAHVASRVFAARRDFTAACGMFPQHVPRRRPHAGLAHVAFHGSRDRAARRRRFALLTVRVQDAARSTASARCSVLRTGRARTIALVTFRALLSSNFFRDARFTPVSWAQ